jgi:hypothetical protein
MHGDGSTGSGREGIKFDAEVPLNSGIKMSRKTGYGSGLVMLQPMGGHLPGRVKALLTVIIVRRG